MKRDVANFINAQCEKGKIGKHLFDEWKNELFTSIESKINSTTIPKHKKPILEQDSVNGYLSQLHELYVITPTDKATNNISMICKKYYLETLINELENTPSYELVNQSMDSIVDAHKIMFKEHHVMDVDDDTLPHIYWLPKQHKKPVGSRFVVSGRKCSVKTLSKDISKALRTVQKSIKFKCNYDHKFSKTSAYWIINSSKQVHEHI